MHCAKWAGTAKRRALALKPDYNEGYNNRGNALIELNRPADALADYDRALEAAPNNVYAWVNRGSALDWRWLHGRDDSPWYRQQNCFGSRGLAIGPGQLQRWQKSLRILRRPASPWPSDDTCQFFAQLD
jgi:tetratricopeptide (TPR) repeat protein